MSESERIEEADASDEEGAFGGEWHDSDEYCSNVGSGGGSDSTSSVAGLDGRW